MHLKYSKFDHFLHRAMNWMCISGQGHDYKKIKKGGDFDESNFTNVTSTISSSSFPVEPTSYVTKDCHVTAAKSRSRRNHHDPLKMKLNKISPRPHDQILSHSLPGNDRGDTFAIQNYFVANQTQTNRHCSPSHSIHKEITKDGVTADQQISKRLNKDGDFLSREHDDEQFIIRKESPSCDDQKTYQADKASTTNDIVKQVVHDNINCSCDITDDIKTEKFPKIHCVTFKESSNVVHVISKAGKLNSENVGKRKSKRKSRKNNKLHGKKGSVNNVNTPIPLSLPIEQFISTSKQEIGDNDGVQVYFDHSSLNDFLSKLAVGRKDIEQTNNPLFKIRVKWIPNDSDKKSEKIITKENKALDDLLSKNVHTCERLEGNGIFGIYADRNTGQIRRSMSDCTSDRQKKSKLNRSLSQSELMIKRKVSDYPKRNYNNYLVAGEKEDDNIRANSSIRTNQSDLKKEQHSLMKEQTSTNNFSAHYHNQNLSPQPFCHQYPPLVLHQSSGQPLYIHTKHPTARANTPVVCHHVHHEPQTTNANYVSSLDPYHCLMHRPHSRNNDNYQGGTFHYHQEIVPHSHNHHQAQMASTTTPPPYQQKHENVPHPHHHYYTQIASSTTPPPYQQKHESVSHPLHPYHMQMASTTLPPYEQRHENVPYSHNQFHHQMTSTTQPTHQFRHEHYPASRMGQHSRQNDHLTPERIMTPTYQPCYSPVNRHRHHGNDGETKLLASLASQVQSFTNVLKENEIKIKALEESIRRTKSPVYMPSRRLQTRSPIIRNTRKIPPPVHLHPPSRPIFPTHRVLSRKPFYFHR